MRVAINTASLLNENKNRGTGTYTKLLLKSLIKIKDADLNIVEFTSKVPENADVVHYPFFDPFFLTLPIKKVKPTVVTVHDLIPLKFPGNFPRGIKGELKWQIQKISLKMSDSIITDSQNSKIDINEITGINLDKITVVPLAGSEVSKPIKDQSKSAKIRSRLCLPESYILYVGDVNWNKNVVGLINAYSSIKKQVLSIKNNKMKDIKLVLVGIAFLNSNLPEVKEINKTIKILGLENEVIKMGFVEERNMSAIYNLAKVYVQPSFYEGFGLPVLDALTSGCPVACSNVSSLPEIGGDAVFYFNPKSMDEISESIINILNFDDSTRLSIINDGYQQASKFSWQKTAEETLLVYKKAYYDKTD